MATMNEQTVHNFLEARGNLWPPTATEIAEETGITKTVVNKVCEMFMDKIVETLKNGEKVSLKGFGTFSVKACPARQGYDMSRGKAVTIPAQNRVSFKFSPAVKDAVK